MEYAAAPSLHTFMWDRRDAPPLPESKVRSVMWKLLTGAKMMHDRHVVHRDIKPGNVLIGQDGKLVKICDLGLAVSMSESPPYTQVGTVPYMAPEMLLHKPDYDALVDTWSLGCLMAEMLTGEPLFDDDYDDDHPNEFSDTDTEHVVQILSIFRVLGMPDDRTWPEFKSLPLAAEVQQLLQHEEVQKHSWLRDIFPEEKLSEKGFQVLQGLFTCNPEKRLTAAKALKHPWFAPPRPSVAAAKVEALPLPTKKTPRFMVPLAVLKDCRTVPNVIVLG
jgi:cell division cycle 2-like protein